MRGKEFSVRLQAGIAILTLGLYAIPATAASTKILHTFNALQGSHAQSVIIGPDGNLYGITVLGGAQGGGTAFQLSQMPGGLWRETKEFPFGAQGPYPNPLIFDSEGNLYGTTELSPNGCGAIFELSLNVHGHWEETVLHSLSCAEGLYPESALVRDSAGNLYGTAWGGGAHGRGTVFELSPATGGWTFSLLHSFDGTDGVAIQSPVAMDSAGNLYGTALCGGAGKSASKPTLAPDCGGASGAGTVWELSPQSDGTWTEKTLHNFNSAGHNDGVNPSCQGQLIFDSAGNLYGTTHNGGTHGLGTVFELSPNGDGTWSEKVLHNFNGPNGIAPSGGVISDAAGNLYGEAFGPGSYLGGGSGGETGGQLVYKLSSNNDGTWAETVLHFFHDPDSGGPAMGLVMDAAGNLYGSTWMGGTYGNGVVFEVTP